MSLESNSRSQQDESVEHTKYSVITFVSLDRNGIKNGFVNDSDDVNF